MVGKGGSAVAANAAVAPKLMASVLVVDDDSSLCQSLVQSLCEHGYEASSVTSFAQALGCVRERHYGVLLTDLHMQGGDGLLLIEALREASPGTRPVLMSADATARESQRALDRGAVRVLCKPFEVEEMLYAVERAAEYSGGFWASVHGLSLVDTLQMLHLARRSLSVRFLGGTNAALHMRDGQLVHAEYGELHGEAALATILKMPAGALQTFALEAVTQSIFKDFQAVLLDQMRQLDEKERDSKTPRPSDPFDEFGDLEDLEPSSQALPRRPDRASGASGARPAVRVAERKQTLEKLDVACERVVNMIEGAVACAVIDLSSGSLLGVFDRQGTSPERHDILAAATVDLFRGPNTSRIEATAQAPRLAEGGAQHAFEEVQLTSKHALHFAKTLQSGQAVVLLVTSRNTSLGMGWAHLRSAVPIFERLMP
jgi:DNA-binding response OmpR family regulator